MSGSADPFCVCLWSWRDPVPNAVQFGITMAKFLAMAPASWTVPGSRQAQGGGQKGYTDTSPSVP